MDDMTSFPDRGPAHREQHGGARVDRSRELTLRVDRERNGSASRLGVHAVAYVRAGNAPAADALLEAQEDAIRAYARRRGWEIATVHGDRSDGRGLFSRPGLAAAVGELEAAADADQAIVIVAGLDRLTESPASLARLLGRAAGRGWQVVALDVEMDTTTPAGRRTADALRQVGAWRRRRISQGTKRGMARAAEQGRLPGRPRTMPEHVLERLRALRASGLSLRAVATTLNDEGSRGPHGGRWSERTVRAALARYGARPTAAAGL